MKKKISLLSLSKNELKNVKGAASLVVSKACGCGCQYAGDQEGPDDDFYGGSSTSDNRQANYSGDIISSVSTQIIVLKEIAKS